MEVFRKISELNSNIAQQKKRGKTIGFVPTMGALHNGHLTLLDECMSQTDYSIVSIFVNPTQFNNEQDFENYPIKIDTDLELLKGKDCDAVFIPEVEEVYPKGESKSSPIQLGTIATEMEGKYRPGHFDGVCTVVKRLFDIVAPDKAFFGEKDFQQLAVIRKMSSELSLPIKIVGCETKRMDSGLAMSSRNLLLSKEEVEQASFIYQSLLKAKNLYLKFTPKVLKTTIEKEYKTSNIELEYFEFCDSETLELVEKWGNHKNVQVCVAGYLGSVRLIDNIRLY